MIKYHEKYFCKLFSNKVIINRLRQIAKHINIFYKNKELSIICVLDGGLVVASDLLKYINGTNTLDFIKVSSYKGGLKAGKEMLLEKDIDFEVSQKNILLIEDIIDSGNTIEFLHKKFQDMNVNDLRIFSLLIKGKSYKKNIKIEWNGFDIEDVFTIGYGMDFDLKFRGLKDIYYLHTKNDKKEEK